MGADLVSQSGLQSVLRQAEELESEDLSQQELAERLAALAPDRATLEAAYLRWQQSMHRWPSDDYEAIAILRALEGALRLLPRSEVFGSSPKQPWI